MSAKAGLDKDTAASVEEKATKEVEDKAQEEKKKEEEAPEVAKNPELPPEEKVDAKDVAQALAPTSEKEEEKAEEKAAPEGEQGKKPEEEASKKEEETPDKAKEEEEKAKLAPGVKKVEDPQSKKKKAEAKSKKDKVKEAKPKDKLVVDGAKDAKAEKREMGDAFFVASLAALLQTDRSLLEKNVKENANRTYTVTFYEKDAASESGYKPHEVTVTPEAPVQEAAGAEKLDQLTQVVKQAYVKWKGGEDKISDGKGGAAMEAITGEPAEFMHANEDAAALWSTLVEACNFNKPIMATTRGEGAKALFKEANVKPFHAYVVLKCKEVNGKQMVTLRNPYGREGQRAGNVIEVDLEKFAELYRGVSIGQSVPEKEPEKPKDEEKTKKDEKAVA